MSRDPLPRVQSVPRARDDRGARRGRRVPTAPCRRSCRRRPTRTVGARRRVRATRRGGAPSRRPRTFAPCDRAGETAVVADLELGGEHGVEAQALGDRTQVHARATPTRSRAGAPACGASRPARPSRPAGGARCTSAANVASGVVEVGRVAAADQLLQQLGLHAVAAPVRAPGLRDVHARRRRTHRRRPTSRRRDGGTARSCPAATACRRSRTRRRRRRRSWLPVHGVHGRHGYHTLPAPIPGSRPVRSALTRLVCGDPP